MKKNGFSLIELSVVLVIASLFFSVLITAVYTLINLERKNIKEAKKLEDEAFTLWIIQRAFLCSKGPIDIEKKGKYSIIYLYTYCAKDEKGLAKEVFFVKDGYLYLYEFPYVYGSKKFYDENKAQKLLKVKEFYIKFYKDKNYFILNLNNKTAYLSKLL